MHAVSRSERVTATPETLHKLCPPPWAGLPPELERAAKEITLALSLVAGPAPMRAASVVRAATTTGWCDFSDHQRMLVKRYRDWQLGMRADGMHCGYVIGILACDEPIAFGGLFRKALRVYDRVNFGHRR